MYCKNVISILFKCVSLTDLIVLKNAIWILDSCVSPRYLFVLKNCIWILDSCVSLRELFVLKKMPFEFLIHVFHYETSLCCKNAIWTLDSCVSLRYLTQFHWTDCLISFQSFLVIIQRISHRCVMSKQFNTVLHIRDFCQFIVHILLVCPMQNLHSVFTPVYFPTVGN